MADKQERIEVKCFGVVCDNQDGGYTAKLYTSRDVWLDEKYADYLKWDVDPGDEDIMSRDDYEKDVDDDEYNHGYQAGDVTIKLVNVDGQWQLAEEVSIHGGQ